MRVAECEFRIEWLGALIVWWCNELRKSLIAGLAHWRTSPEWPLLVAGVGLLLSFIVHLTIYLLARGGIAFAPTEWEGRIGWRKPILFAISNAMVFTALAKALRSQRLVPRLASAHAAAWGTVIEVSAITLQAWRGRASHFNTTTPLDATLYAIKLVGVSTLGLVCLTTAAGCWMRPSMAASASDRAALKFGLLLLSIAVIVGFVQVGYGHILSSITDQRLETEQACRRATANAHGAPCYEVYGEALLKILHFVPLHSTEVLLFLSWAATRAKQAPAHRVASVRLAAAGLALLTAGSAWQVAHGGRLSLHGMARLDMDRPAISAVLAGVVAVFSSFSLVVLSPLWTVGGSTHLALQQGRGQDRRCGARRAVARNNEDACS